jgi:hypothetical protein
VKSVEALSTSLCFIFRIRRSISCSSFSAWLRSEPRGNITVCLVRGLCLGVSPHSISIADQELCNTYVLSGLSALAGIRIVVVVAVVVIVAVRICDTVGFRRHHSDRKSDDGASVKRHISF